MYTVLKKQHPGRRENSNQTLFFFFNIWGGGESYLKKITDTVIDMRKIYNDKYKCNT